MMMASNSPFSMAFTTVLVMPSADISGFKSYVATLGEGTRMRSSPLNGFSTPPLKKYVTCAYFSVSAHRRFLYCKSWNTCARMCSSFSGMITHFSHSHFLSYLVMPTKKRFLGRLGSANLSKFGASSAKVICRARSARKLVENHGVVIVNRANCRSRRPLAARNHHRLHEFVGHALLVAALQRGHGIAAFRLRLAVSQRAISQFDAFPTVIAVHGVIA